MGRGVSILLFLLLLFCSAVARTFTFIPQWRPQAQFAGYYVAYEKGFYREAGIRLRILTGGPDSPSTELLKDGKADFATMWLSTAIKMKAHGVDLVNIAQILQRSSLTLVAWRSKVKRLEDLSGKKVGVWGKSFMVPLKAFLKKHGLGVRIVPEMGSINLFLLGGVDAATAMWYNEYDTIINSGVEPEELTTFQFYKYGFNFPEDGIYVLKSTYHRYPDVCRRFVEASIRGWVYAFEHPDEAVDIVLKYMRKAHVPASRVHQMWMLNALRDAFFYHGEGGIGVLRREDFESVARILKDEGIIGSIPEFSDFYKGCVGAEKK